MDISKHFSLFLQTVSVIILGLTFAGIKSEGVPAIFQPLFIIPWYGYGLVFVILVIVVITQKEKIRQIRSAPPAPPALQKVDAIAYQGVTWDILAPARHPLEKPADYARRLPTVGGARIPPKCPKCGVELEEKEGLLYGHIWKCVACGFKKRNRDSFSTEAGRAEKIWRAKAEADAAAAVAAPAATTPAAATVLKE
jgi:ribosomal protein L37AE/L43A